MSFDLTNKEKSRENMLNLLQFAVDNNASDLHITSGEPPILRIDGEMERLEINKLTSEESKNLIYSIMTENQIQEFEKSYQVDFSIAPKELNNRFRVNVYNQNRGIASAFRNIPDRIYNMEELGLTDNIFKELSLVPRGLVLVTGPTGSGKSTTLAAMIDHINKNKSQHIITIEDPIEFVHEGIKSVFNQRELKRDTEDFSSALRASLREDPDIILVGEMRDLETIRLALTAAETGHAVFATLHTNSASKTIDRIIDVFPGEEKEMIRTMLSESLVGVVSQTLLKKKHGGRVAAHEILIGNDAIKNLIRENKVAQIYSTIQTSNKDGMKTLDQSLIELVEKGIITNEIAAEKAKNPKDFLNY